jgi:uncharacterized membrane protein YeiB
VTHSAPRPDNSRIIGIDVARGLALAGMLAVHVFPTFDSDGSASIATAFTSGRGAAIFATMAGVGLSFVTGRQRPVSGGARVAASVGLVVRALLLCLIGLLLGYVTIAGDLDVYVILPYYAVMFLLAVPLLGVRPQVLAVMSVSLAAAASWLASSLLLFRFGGLGHIRDNAPAGIHWTDSRLLWEPWGDFDTFWWYAGRAPHSGTPFDMLHTLGFAVAVLGAALLVTRRPLAARLLWPIAAAGSMVLTLYCAHIAVLATGLLGDQPYARYCALLSAMIIFAVLWKRTHTRGPLEELVSRISTRARLAVARPTREVR